MTEPEGKKPSKRARILALALGVSLGVSCYWVPPDYQTVCQAVSKIIAGGCS